MIASGISNDDHGNVVELDFDFKDLMNCKDDLLSKMIDEQDHLKQHSFHDTSPFATTNVPSAAAAAYATSYKNAGDCRGVGSDYSGVWTTSLFMDTSDSKPLSSLYFPLPPLQPQTHEQPTSQDQQLKQLLWRATDSGIDKEVKANREGQHKTGAERAKRKRKQSERSDQPPVFFVIVASVLSNEDDNVSVLYDDPDIDDDDCLPPATIDVLQNLDLEEDDDSEAEDSDDEDDDYDDYDSSTCISPYWVQEKSDNATETTAEECFDYTEYGD